MSENDKSRCVMQSEDTLNPQAWEATYRDGNTPWDLEGPTPELMRLLEEGIFKPGAAILFPGSGKGHDPIAFAAKGFRVTALDFAPTAIVETKANAERAGVDLEIVEADLFEWSLEPANARFDYIVEQTIFCAIHPSRRKDFAHAMANLLRPNAKLITLIFPLEERPSGPPFGVSLDSVRDSYSPYFDLDILPTLKSIKPRQGREMLGIFTKK